LDKPGVVLFLQPLGGLGDPFADPSLRHVHRGRADPEFAHDLPDRLFLQNVQVINLVPLGRHLAAHLLLRHRQQVARPFRIPDFPEQVVKVVGFARQASIVFWVFFLSCFGRRQKQL